MTYFSVLDWILCGVGVVLVIFLLVLVKQILSLRRVVPTNEVHTVRRGNKTLIYGADVYDGKTFHPETRTTNGLPGCHSWEFQ